MCVVDIVVPGGHHNAVTFSCDTLTTYGGLKVRALLQRSAHSAPTSVYATGADAALRRERQC